MVWRRAEDKRNTSARSKNVTNVDQNMVRDYVCVKCRGREPRSREVTLSKSTGFLGLMPSEDNRYVEITCALCGYTEFFNRAIFLKSLAPVENGQKIALPEEVEGG